MNLLPKKVCITTLGCDKNRADSEVLAGYLQRAGCQIIGNDDEADILIVNTCGFINSAREESINAITAKLPHKSHAQLVVCGCIVPNNEQALKEGLPEVDLWWGTKDYEKLAEQLTKKPAVAGEKLLSTPSSYVYIKIADGCNRRCAFCTIPLIRGNYVSRPLAEIVSEVQHFASLGVPEYILVAQDVTMYGFDIQTNLVELLRAITAIDGVKRVRLHYCYPELLTDSLLAEIATNSRIVKYLDIPFQHCNARILKLMGRRGDAETYRALIEKIRTVIPGVTLRATMMVGFPTETEAEFNELLDFLRKVKLDYVGFFAYSREKGTTAYVMEQVNAAVKRARLRAAERVQQAILDTKLANERGQMVHVVCDSVVDGVARCRTAAQSPEVDPCIYVDQDDINEPLIVGHEYDIRL
ncbi:MAG: 30S ribosomal protein S12 methylthiotransferase RimO [Eubacteriales bacterium]|nr:30S ribosomal protein S12 methylthiotransferase RimO [Eubacteriales bacterium]